MRRALIALVAISLGSAAGCGRHAATSIDCEGILDRLVELELTESGYRDPVARARWRSELRRRFSVDLERCRGLTVRNDLERCLSASKGSEDLVHNCVE